MRWRLSLILITLCISVFASIHTRRVEWLPIEKWTIENVEKNVLSFWGAKYVEEEGIPCIVEDVSSENVSLKNIQYAPCTLEEVAIISKLNVKFSEFVDWKIVPKTECGVTQYSLCINPIVIQNGVYKKIVAFEYQISDELSAISTKVVQTEDVVSSVLSTGVWYKIKVTNTGIHKLTADDLAKMGCTPANVRVFGYGGAMLNENFSLPYFHDLPELSIWRGKDYVLFMLKDLLNGSMILKIKLCFIRKTHILMQVIIL